MTIIDEIKERLKHDWDYVYAITGQSGCGMSLMSLSVGKAGDNLKGSVCKNPKYPKGGTVGESSQTNHTERLGNSSPAPNPDKKEND